MTRLGEKVEDMDLPLYVGKPKVKKKMSQETKDYLRCIKSGEKKRECRKKYLKR